MESEFGRRWDTCRDKTEILVAMINPDLTKPISSLTMGDLFAYARDLAIMVTVLTFGWKSRGFWQHVQNNSQQDRKLLAEIHASSLATKAIALETKDNHIAHIESALAAEKEYHEQQIELSRSMDKTLTAIAAVLADRGRSA